ncbi:hypothetical protein [Mycobacteroides salmoniphilum]|uniref:hypothetical protein n=1 Tax=Mycobacteroides salmoniphilum TaxID=404941 RepID=UPI001064B60F|nr:hypothetical protein [Mycobacteroides salmoniphilum]TDZ77067.1 hypothetical protein DE4586_02853 [Mycobacteroides salmoniphilum]TDZ86770.1 hypothetical protein DE4587_02157 [Mycobacteroides salmoniphilum]
MAKTMADLRPADRIYLGHAAHEAAHAAIGVLSGARIQTAEVLRGGPRTGHLSGVAGQCRYSRTPISDIRQADITAAGTVGEAIWHYGGRPTSHQLDTLLDKNAQDRNKLADLTRDHHGTTPSDSLSAVLPLVLRCWPSIARLASQIHHDGPVDHAAVLAALGIPSTEDALFHAAQIKAGQRPGTFTIRTPYMRF